MRIMGLRRLCFLLSVSFVFALAACGDNSHKVFEDAGVDTNVPPMIDAAVDAPPDALMCSGTGEMICNNTCINTNTDNNNCGSCGNACTGGTCQSGICCPTGQTNCGGTCVDLTTSL